MHTDSRLLFQKLSKLVQDKWPKGHIALSPKNQFTFQHHLLEPLERFPSLPPNFYVSVLCGPSLIFHVSSKSVQVRGSYNQNTLPRPPPKWKQYRLSELIVMVMNRVPNSTKQNLLKFLITVTNHFANTMKNVSYTSTPSHEVTITV